MSFAAVSASLLPAASRARGVASRCGGGPTPCWRRASRHVWWLEAATGEPDPINGGVTTQLVAVRDGSRIWLVGSGPTPDQGRALAASVERMLGGAVTDLIATRAAPQLALGNVAFPAARRWALPETIAAMRERCETCSTRLRAELGAAGAGLRPELIRVPDRAIGARGATHGRLGPFAWLALERSPGEPVLVLRHEADHVVIAQGLLWAGAVPDLRETRSDAMLASLHRLAAWAGASRLLGEQGGEGGRHDVAQHVRYIEALRTATAAALQRGDLEPVELPAWRDGAGYPLRHGVNAQRVWRELEPALFR
ncbi:MAG: hypothetical protein JSR59_07310 [Proteobacteria bacterium]|nr:hypothetical protein [Pseudomonadota bacterium]